MTQPLPVVGLSSGCSRTFDAAPTATGSGSRLRQHDLL
jgi:hypothetical protein